VTRALGVLPAWTGSGVAHREGDGCLDNGGVCNIRARRPFLTMCYVMQYAVARHDMAGSARDPSYAPL
jgi:hypothetical protein